MNVAGTFGTVVLADPSFQADGPWQGTFDICGRPARVVSGDQGWLLASLTSAGDGLELLRMTAGVPEPVKVTAGPYLVAELPCGNEHELAFEAVRTALHEGLVVLGLAYRSGVQSNELSAARTPDLERAFDESRFGWAVSDGMRTVRAGSTTITADLADGAAVFRTRLIRLAGVITTDALSALADFLLVVNGRLRFARAVFVNDRPLLEAVAPLRLLTPSAIDRAVEALAVGAVAIKRECAALTNAEVACRYLEFHNKWREDHADRDA
jgi:hypothetical protein